jgi:hypothetical protein
MLFRSIILRIGVFIAVHAGFVVGVLTFFDVEEPQALVVSER